VIVLLLGCRHRPVEPPPPLVPMEVAVAGAPAGTVEGGLFTDAAWPFTISVPEGWTATPGVAGGATRVTLADTLTGTTVQVLVAPGREPGPAPRDDCDWDFVDTARYRVLHLNRPVTIATCTPHAPDGPHRLGWYVADGDLAWTIEASVPRGGLADVRPTLEPMLGTIRLR
jgi:hypothetical protein